MKPVYRIVVVATLLLLSPIVSANMVAYGLSSHPFTDVPQGVRLCYLDTAHTGLDRLNVRLRALPKADAAAWINAHPQKVKAAAKGITCLFLARDAHITKLPAIVNNNQRVVYGMRDVGEAITTFTTTRGGH